MAVFQDYDEECEADMPVSLSQTPILSQPSQATSQSQEVNEDNTLSCLQDGDNPKLELKRYAPHWEGDMRVRGIRTDLPTLFACVWCVHTDHVHEQERPQDSHQSSDRPINLVAQVTHAVVIMCTVSTTNSGKTGMPSSHIRPLSRTDLSTSHALL